MKTIDDISKVEQKMTWNPYMNQKNQVANIYNEKTRTNQGKPLRGNQVLKKRNLNAQEEELNPTKKTKTQPKGTWNQPLEIQNPIKRNLKPINPNKN